MLILTQTDTSCSGITILSDVSDYADPTIASIDITATITCCTDTAVTYQITDFATPDSLLVDNATTGNREIQLTPEFFGTTDALNDGVYSITIKVTLTDDSFVEEVGCILMDCYVKCIIVDLIQAGDYDAHRIYESIIMANNCIEADCDCSAACNLFLQLVTKLQISNNNANINDCGCS